MGNVNVPIKGFERPVPVLITDSTKLPMGRILPPDARQVRVFVSVDRGQNVHGALIDEFSVCRDIDIEHSRRFYGLP